jgi:toxin ParE1/3/4
VSSKPVIPRERALRDIQEATEHYFEEGLEKAALGFLDALERAFLHLSRYPATGSLRYAHALDLPGLRVWPVGRYPHVIFFVAQDDHVDVWRVLHGQMDIPTWLASTWH